MAAKRLGETEKEKTEGLKVLRPREPSDRLELKGRGKPGGLKMLRQRQPNGILPQYGKRKPNPWQPRDWLKLERRKNAEGFRQREPSDRLKLKRRGKTEGMKMLRPRHSLCMAKPSQAMAAKRLAETGK